jgi:hypothetical protein
MSRDVSTVDGGAPEFSVRAAGSFFQHPADGLNAYQNILYNLDHMIVSTFLLFLILLPKSYVGSFSSLVFRKRLASSS